MAVRSFLSTVFAALLLQATALDSATQSRRGSLLAHGARGVSATQPHKGEGPVNVKVEVHYSTDEKEAPPSAKQPEVHVDGQPLEVTEEPQSVKGALHRAILGHRQKMRKQPLFYQSMKKKKAPIEEDTINTTSVEKLVEYTDHNSAEKSLDDKTPTVSPEKWNTCLENVVGTCESRYIGSHCIPQVVEKLQGFLKAAVPAGAISTVQDFPVHIGAATAGHNIITRIPGEEKEKIVIVGAHYDTIPSSGPAQGAEDNGSGVATLLAVAEALKQTEGCCKYTVEFIMFSGEEEGLLGSTAFVRSFKAGTAVAESNPKAETVVGAIIMDEVAYARPERHHARHLIFETSGHSAPVEKVVDTLAHAAQVTNARSDDPDVIFEINYDGFASDHMTFLNAGIPAVLVIERDNMYYASKFGHTSRDTVKNIDQGLGASVANIVAQAAANLAGAKSS